MAGFHVVIVTGMSGAGRSTALHALEDLGFFCVDNLPPSLAPGLIELVASGEELDRIALGMDVRTGAFLEGAELVLDQLIARGHEVEVLFVDCADEALVRRFSETRRPHPLAAAGDILDGIHRERERLGPLRARAQHVLDTTTLTVHDLRRTMADFVAESGETRMVTRVVSFGFKFGVPVDADLVFDLRYLPNPHFVSELRALSGRDKPVADFVLQSPEAKELLEDLLPLLRHSLPRYAREGKSYLTIAVGCTGGRHRSVAIAEELGRLLGEEHDLQIRHRDMDRKIS